MSEHSGQRVIDVDTLLGVHCNQCGAITRVAGKDAWKPCPECGREMHKRLGQATSGSVEWVVRFAVAAERERCAKIVDDDGRAAIADGYHDYWTPLAARIRSGDA